ncbi:unnamed protein product [Linum trigynum]|uniref:Reverse transcriptase domain-containing protein n=1 Tax=Linum trigynum TaxID=586398 RepID=A0AAV2CJU6_9ROSI
METKQLRDENEALRNEMGFSHGGSWPCDISRGGRAGGVSIWWSEEVKAEVIEESQNYMDLKVEEGHDKVWRFTGIYGWAEGRDKHRTLELIRERARQWNGPWICGGDFNQILSDREKKGGNPGNEVEMQAFAECLAETGLCDLGFHGYPFTWENRRSGGGYIEERLDRYLANEEWQNLWPSARVLHLDSARSDHRPISCETVGDEDDIKWGWNFRFEPLWVKHAECAETIKEAWASAAGETTAKIAHVQEKLDQWSRVTFPNFGRQKEKIRRALRALDRREKTDEIILNKQKLQLELEDLECDEELFWKQRSRADWLREGDQNTSFFHRKASMRRKRNLIRKLRDESGAWWRGNEDVSTCLTKYFSELFMAGGRPPQTPVLDSVETRVNDEMNAWLERPLTREELYEALRQMGKRKASGPDGMSVLFFVRYWDIVGDEISELLLGAWESGIMPAGLNHTLIALIPKVKDQVMAREFRPISLCNVMYKMLSKAMANRLKSLLDTIISPEQSAFVPGRFIADNVMTAFECFHTMKKKTKNKTDYLAAKTDMAKAYDRVEWWFLEEMMSRLGFAASWIQRTMMCVKSVTYSILVNGHRLQSFAPSRGIRQGDPLSPYLFLLVAEGLSSYVSLAAKQKRIHGLSVARGAPVISHLFFADDAIFFARATVKEGLELRRVLDDYQTESGQMVSLEKSEVTFGSNVKMHQRLMVSSTLGMKVVEKHDKYLGLVTQVGRSKKELFVYLKDRVRKKLSGWKERTMSIAAREVLIKSVAQAQLTYTMSVFKVLDGVIDEIHGLITQFWWGQRGQEKRIPWIAREGLICSKAQGGMGFRDLRGFNKALLARQVWNLYTRPDSLVARLLKAKYHKNDSILDARVGGRPSYVWRSLMSAQEFLVEGMCWRIGNGATVRIWGDRWVPSAPGFIVQSSPTGLPVDAVVRDLFEEGLERWDDTMLESCFSADMVHAIRQIPLRDLGEPDCMIWADSKDGRYTARDGYRTWLGKHQQEVGDRSMGEPAIWNRLWAMHVPPKVKIFMWKFMRGALATGEQVSKRNPRRGDSSPFCNQL